MLANKRNPKTNNQNFKKVNDLTSYDRKTLKRWWDNREALITSKYKNCAEKLKSDKYKGKFPVMEDRLDDFAKELRDSGFIVSWFTLKIKVLQI